MYRNLLIHQVLEILMKNIEANEHPNLVDSRYIASKLGINIQDTKKLLKTMEDMGIIISNMETEYSLITQTGIQRVN